MHHAVSNLLLNIKQHVLNQLNVEIRDEGAAGELCQEVVGIEFFKCCYYKSVLCIILKCFRKQHEKTIM